MRKLLAMGTLLTLTLGLLLSACAEESTPEQRFIASNKPTAMLFSLGEDNVMRRAGELTRGMEVTVYPNDTDYYYFAYGIDDVSHFFYDYAEHLNFVNSDMYRPD